MSYDSGEGRRRRDVEPIPAWEQRGGSSGPAPAYRPAQPGPAGPPPQGPGGQPPFRGRGGPGAPPVRRPPPPYSPSPLSGPAAGIGASPAPNTNSNAYSQTADPADTRNDEPQHTYGHEEESGAQMSPAPARRTNKTNVTAIVALILSVIGLTFLIGIVCGHVARAQIRRTGEQGASFAVAALWVGYLYLAAGVLVLGGYLYIVGKGS
ncbi:DUF4190 domain-containing protein [Williamsia sp. 1138]|uniref:DUF4190 domain-containing protein n=1 Tax=Williamsia sp. 1138 TaxID=1903117 RepID=UPI001FEDE054|nr:DUF4190 domain-containing protein [Williamsia sp. 1138]